MKTLLVTVLALFGLVYSSMGQDCPDGCTVEESNKFWSFLFEDPDCKFYVNYDVLNCGGVTSYKIRGISASGSCAAMANFSIYHYNIKSVEEYLSIAFLEAMAGSVPDCDDTEEVVKIYTANCGIWVGCEYEVDPGTRECDEGYLPPYPNYGVNPTKVKVYKWQPCGTICCENVYEICKEGALATDPGLKHMEKISSAPHGSSTCSGASQYTPLACQHGCL